MSYRKPTTILLCLFLGSGCAFFATRPVQEMSFTAAAIRAAQEVQADTLSPDYFRQALSWFIRAKREYRFKNFHLARDYSTKARLFAERAEFESVRNGGNRQEQGGPDPLANAMPSAPASDPAGDRNVAPLESSPPQEALPPPTGVPTPADPYYGATPPPPVSVPTVAPVQGLGAPPAAVIPPAGGVPPVLPPK